MSTPTREPPEWLVNSLYWLFSVIGDITDRFPVIISASRLHELEAKAAFFDRYLEETLEDQIDPYGDSDG